MAVHTKKQFYEANLATVRGFLERTGIAFAPDAPFVVEKLDAPPFQPQVEVHVAAPDGPIIVVLENRNDARDAFRRTASFNLWHKGALSPAGVTVLNSLTDAIEKLDQGDLALEVPRHIGYRLPVNDPNFKRDPFWRRERFDRNVVQIPPEEARSRGVGIVVTQACKMNCVFCPEGDRRGYLLTGENATPESFLEDLKYQLKRARELGADSAEIDGSDVLLYPYIVDFFEEAGRLGFQRLMVQTPGQELARRDLAAAVARTPVTDVRVPFYGSRAKIHDSVVGVKGAFDGLIRALETVREFKRPVFRPHTIALKKTLDHLVETLDETHDRFGLAVRVNMMHPNRDGEDKHLREMVTFTEIRPLIAERPVHFFEFPLCQFPVDDALEMYRVRKQLLEKPLHSSSAVNFYDLGLNENSEHWSFKQARTINFPSPCNGCLLKDCCPGVYGSYQEMYGDNELSTFTDQAAIDKAMERRGEPFPKAQLAVAAKVELITGKFDPGELPAIEP